jgi:rubrerythrin
VVRGTGEQEKMLKNAKTEFQDEAEEIATYTAIETLATAVGDKETAQLAKQIRREEERMSNFLARLIPTLSKAVVTEEVPAAQRRKPTRRRSSGSTSRRRSTTSASSSRSTSRSRSSAGRSRSSKGSSRRTKARS